MPITALPTPPSRNDPANFAVRADAFLGALPAFATEANELQVDVNAKQTASLNSANNSAASAVESANSAIASAASASAASATAGVTEWNPATAYTVGQNAYDTTDFFTYRRKVAGTTATRPGLDSTNWELISGNVTTTSNQTITGVKTFNAPEVRITGGDATYSGNLYLGTGRRIRNVVASNDWELVNAANTAVIYTLANNGNFTATGSILASNNVTAFSDIRLKTDLTKIVNALDKVGTLNGYTYTRTDTGIKQTGLIAQEVQAVLPEAVTQEGEYLALAYGNLMGLMVEAIKELKARVEFLEDKYGVTANGTN